MSINNMEIENKENWRFDDFYFGKPLWYSISESVLMAKEKKTNTVYAIMIEDKLFIEEINVLCRWSHPNILPVLGTFEDDLRVYMVTPIAERGDMKHYLEKNGTLSTEETAHYTLHLMHAIRYCHSQNILHGDIIPENILIDRHHNLLVSDFSKVSPKSPLFASVARKVCVSRKDIRTIGYILHEMLAGKPPSFIKVEGLNQFEVPSLFTTTATDMFMEFMETATSLPSDRCLNDIIFHKFIVEETGVSEIESFDCVLPETKFIRQQKLKGPETTQSIFKEAEEPRVSLFGILSKIAQDFERNREEVNHVTSIAFPSVTSSSSYLNNLYTHLQLQILKELEFRDFVSLASTCRKWYHIAASSPEYVKPNLIFPNIIVDGSAFTLSREQVCSVSVRDNRKTWVNRTPRATFFRKLKCTTMKINGCPNTSTPNTPNQLLRFLHKHRSSLEIEELIVKLPVICEEDVSSIYSLAGLATQISINISSDLRQFYEMCLFDVQTLFQTNLSYTEIEIYYHKDILDLTNMILKQWTRGERPNLQRLYTRRLQRRGYVDIMLNGMEQFVTDRHIEIGSEFPLETARFVVPGLPDMYINAKHVFEFTRSSEINRRNEQ